MSSFYVGQRVRVARRLVGLSNDGGLWHSQGIKVGDTATIAGTPSHPNPGFLIQGAWDVSIRLDSGPLGMAPSSCLEPITDSYDKVDWSECLWRPTHEEQMA